MTAQYLGASGCNATSICSGGRYISCSGLRGGCVGERERGCRHECSYTLIVKWKGQQSVRTPFHIRGTPENECQPQSGPEMSGEAGNRERNENSYGSYDLLRKQQGGHVENRMSPFQKHISTRPCVCHNTWQLELQRGSFRWAAIDPLLGSSTKYARTRDVLHGP